MGKANALTIASIALGVGIVAAVGEFATISAAPCDASAPVLSDGTRQAPGNWGTAWVTLTFLSAACFGCAARFGMRYGSEESLSGRKANGAAIGVGVTALVILWIAGAAYWASQCPA